MKLGMIVRGDHGGLASQTYEAWRHLKPDRALLMDLGEGRGRGNCRPEMYAADWCETTLCPRRGHGHEVERFLDGLDVVWTAETVYDDRTFALSRNYRVAVVVHVNPELFWDANRFADVLWAPTTWRIEHLPRRTEHVPFPVALDRFEFRPRKRIEVLFHTSGEAMLDRNGTDLVHEMCFHIERPCKLYIRGGPEPASHRWQAGKVDCHWLPGVEHYWEVIPDDVDLMVLPRRYGGLCLPVQEAAALGIPTVMTDLSPQNQWDHPPELLVRAGVLTEGVHMKGGRIDVHTADPRRLARPINMIMSSEGGRLERLSHKVRAWAEDRSWDRRLPEWQRRLEAAQILTLK